MPKRIQMTRNAPWRADNPGAVIVARPSKWGNPCSWKPPLDRLYAARAYYNWLTGCLIQRHIHGAPPTVAEIQDALRGKDLACWCPIDQPCHADILLELANATQ